MTTWRLGIWIGIVTGSLFVTSLLARVTNPPEGGGGGPETDPLALPLATGLTGRVSVVEGKTGTWDTVTGKAVTNHAHDASYYPLSANPSNYLTAVDWTANPSNTVLQSVVNTKQTTNAALDALSLNNGANLTNIPQTGVVNLIGDLAGKAATNANVSGFVNDVGYVTNNASPSFGTVNVSGAVTGSMFIVTPGLPGSPQFYSRANSNQTESVIRAENNSGSETWFIVGPAGGVSLGLTNFAGNGNLLASGTVSGAVVRAGVHDLAGKQDVLSVFAGQDSTGTVTSAAADAGKFLRADGSWQVIAELVWSSVPAATNSAGLPGQIAYNTNYLFVCVATNMWRRAALAAW